MLFLHCIYLLGNYELLGDLLSQLSWLISTARSGNAISMLADYRLHKSKIPEQVSAEYIVCVHVHVPMCVVLMLLV